MQYHSRLFLILLVLCCQIGHASNITVPPAHVKQEPVSKTAAAAKWNTFWKAFTEAFQAKDKKRLVALTSPQFYDGGGATIDQWLDGEVFGNEKTYAHFVALLKKPVTSFKGFDSNPYKATGKNKSGDLFFEYRKGQWLFGGMVGD